MQKKRKLAAALAVAQHTYRDRKRQRLENGAKMATEIEPSNLSPRRISSPTLPSTSVRDFVAASSIEAYFILSRASLNLKEHPHPK